MILKNFQPRLYQETILNTCVSNNTLVVIPTGMGKTGISLMLAVQRLKQYPNSKILVLAPTKPLLDQHLNTFSSHLNMESIDCELFTTFSGSISPDKRKELWEKNQIIFATPQTIDNDIISGRIKLDNVSLICFDECHRATGDYAYVYISNQYKKNGRFQRILGLTASPGVDVDKINEVILNLDISKIEIRTEEDNDVKPYVQDIKMNYIGVEFPKELELIHKNLKLCLRSKLEQIKQNGYINSIDNKTKRDLLSLQGVLQSQIAIGDRSMELMRSISLSAEALKIEHAIEMLETQGVHSMNLYMAEMFSKAPFSKIKAVQNLVNDPYFIRSYELSKKFSDSIPHPKIEKLKEILSNLDKDSKAIIFSNYRDTASYIKEKLSDLDLKCETFFGQSSKKEKGMTQKKQAEVLDDFREGRYNVIIATSLHPQETIVVKSPRGEIMVREIGEFVDQFLKLDGHASSKMEDGWEVFTTDGETSFFALITHIHRHKRQNNVILSRLRSCGDFLVTENHSILSFNEEGKHVPEKPEEGVFVNTAFSAPNIKKEITLDLVEIFLLELPKEELSKFYVSLLDLNQSKIRKLKSEIKFMISLNGITSKKIIANRSKLNESTVTSVAIRLKKRGFINVKTKGREKIFIITDSGEKYKKFLVWINEVLRYSKGKYRVKLKSFLSAPPYFNDFIDMRVELSYGKLSFPRLLRFNEGIAKFLGYFVSEGSARNTDKTGQVSLISKSGGKIKRDMKKSVEEGFGIAPAITSAGVHIYGRLAYYLIRYVFKCGDSTINKQVPTQVFSSSDDIKWAFLQAYFEGDGYSTEDIITLTTISRKLATGLVFILRQLGIRKITVRREVRKKPNHHDIYRVNVYESLPFRQIKQKEGKKTYYDVVPSALANYKIYGKFSNKYLSNKRYPKCRKKSVITQRNSFDYIYKNEVMDKQPKFVYDISVKNTERFFGGSGLACLHNSVAEEGLDIPEVDLIIFFEPVPSAIRSVQRRGRTGRKRSGEVYVLFTKGTRDEAYRWSAYHKEKKMYRNIEKIAKSLNLISDTDKNNSNNNNNKNSNLSQFISNNNNINSHNNNNIDLEQKTKIKIFADTREKNSSIIRNLVDNDINVELKVLDAGDYILSKEVGVEFKKVKDFVDSIVDGRLLIQLKRLKEYYLSPLLVIEGEEDIYSIRNVHPNAIMGMLATITTSYKIPVIQTKNSEETTNLFKILISKSESDSNYSPHSSKGSSLKSQQEYLVSSLPNIGLPVAKELLNNFKTIKNIVNASEAELRRIDLIGEKKAKQIKEIFNEEYEG